LNENLSRNNHYLSQMYLDAWKNKNDKVEIYKLLVPNSNIPMWNQKSIRSVGSFDSIFVRLKNGKETDDIERWFNEKYETPVKEALVNAINGGRITKEEWHLLIDFLVCHIVRSPAFIIKTLEEGKKCNSIFQEIMDEISKMNIDDFVKEKQRETIKNNNDMFPFKMTNLGNLDEKNVLIKAETMIGKQFYLWYIIHILENTSKIFHNYKWGIIIVDEKVVLPTSDDPVICLNYNNEKDYNFDGGWGKKNCNILFPISPNKIIYTQIGMNVKSRWQVDYKMSMLFKKMIIEHSHRMIISNFKDKDVEKIKTRYVDETEFKREIKMWEDFQKNYLERESEFIK